MNSRGLNILALPEPTKNAFVARLDVIRANLRRRIDCLPGGRQWNGYRTRLFELMKEFESDSEAFVIGFDGNFGEWQDLMESRYNEITDVLAGAEEEMKQKGGEPK